MNFAVLERENKDLKDQVLTLTEQLEFLTTELKSKSDAHVNSFGSLEEKIHQIKAERTSERKKSDASKHSRKLNKLRACRKIAVTAFALVFNAHQHNMVHSMFNMWKFWIYKKAKLQEELEAKVTLI